MMQILHCVILLSFLWCLTSNIASFAQETMHFEIDETSVAAGVEHSCAINVQSNSDVSGKILCWGENASGQSAAPPGEYIQVSTGRLHTCAVGVDETVTCWGAGITEKRPDGLFEQVSCGDFHSCGVLKDKSLKCWGDSSSGATDPPAGQFAQVSCGRGFSCALTTEGEAKCWGENSRGQRNVPSGHEFLQISASSGDFVCGLSTERAIVCWGDNSRKQCEPPAGEYLVVSASRLSACALTTARRAVCWGMPCGVTAAPTDVELDELTLGWNHGCGVKVDDGSVICWGDRNSGRSSVPYELQA